MSSERGPGSEEPSPGGLAEGEPIHRRIQKAGPSTYVVSLPKDWVQREGLKPGHSVSWVSDSEGNLRLVPPLPTGRRAPPKIFILRAEHFSSPTLPQRVLRSAYALGYDQVRLEERGPIDPGIRTAVEKASRELLGFSLTEATRTHLVVASFLDPTTHPVSEVVSRLGMNVDVLLERLEALLADQRIPSVQSLTDARADARRLHSLALRQLNLAATNSRLARELGVTRSSHLLGSRVVVKLLDEMGEAIEAVASELAKVKRLPKSWGPALGTLRESVAAIRRSLAEALEALAKGDAEQAHAVLAGREDAVQHFLKTDIMLTRVRGAPSTRHELSLCNWWTSVARQRVEAIAEVALTRSLDRHPAQLTVRKSA